MDLNKIHAEIKREIAQRKESAQAVAERNLDYALTNREFAENYRQQKEQTLRIARAMYEKGDVVKEEEAAKALLQRQAEILAKLNLSPKDLEPQYFCKTCHDTGVKNGKKCRCYNHLLQKKLMNSGIDKNAVFEKSELNETNRNIYRVGKSFAEGKSKYRNMLLVGECGTGKTHFVSCIVNRLLENEIPTAYLSAYDLNEEFLQIHVTPVADRHALMERFYADVLVIDDLGTEPMYQNVTKEYLYHILNERLLTDKSTLITTNLSLEQILSRYGERIFSRLSDRRNTLVYRFQGNDKRLEP